MTSHPCAEPYPPSGPSEEQKALEAGARAAAAGLHPTPPVLAGLLSAVLPRVTDANIDTILKPLGLRVRSFKYHTESNGVINPTYFVTCTAASATDDEALPTRELVLRVANPHPLWQSVSTGRWR